LLGIALWHGSVASFADGTVYALSELNYDSNLFRLSDDVDASSVIGTDQRSDTYLRSEAGLRLQASPGRQQFTLNGNVYQMNFDQFNELDYHGAGADATWNWVVGSAWQGDAGYHFARTLASFETQEAGQNLRTQNDGFIDAKWAVGPRLRIDVGGVDTRVRYSRRSSQFLDYDGTSGEFSINYVAAEANVLGVMTRVTKANYPTPQPTPGGPVNNSYRETGTGLTFDWRTGGFSRLFGDILFTQRTHEELEVRDFDGTTGSLTFDWNATPKILWRLGALRELSAADDLSAGYVIADSATLTPTWSISDKLRLQISTAVLRRVYRGDPLVATGERPERDDDVRVNTILLDYKPSNWLGISLGGGNERRTSNQAGADYRNNSAHAKFRIEF
jgi:exopolysaccharide biosynthesis operon protein EpsL